ncbi:MAG: LysM peptidoglycan-binding domain-containing protein [bacterium]|nr:LysM peptidoglycan-binding domain-containing protein [bacterium]
MDIPDTSPNGGLLRKITEKTGIIFKKLKGDRFGFFFVFILVISFLAIKGSPSEGQKSILGALFTKYIDETAASIIRPTSAQLAEINSLYTQNYSANGEGVTINRQTLATIQDNSIVSYNSVDTDTAELSKQLTGTSSQISIYAVQEGDTLSFIAEDYGVSVNTIVWANNLTNINYLKPGTELKIPPITGILHTVKSGDTLSSISKKYGVEQEKILSYNLLPKIDQLKIGQELIIPGGTLKTSSGTATAAASVTRFAYLPDLGGYFAQPTTGYNWGRIHGRNGVDIANSCGTGIYAASSGTVDLVRTSGWNGGFGLFIRLLHPNSTETLYAHLSKIYVSSGESVEKGELIALMGTTGRSTGCHLHFEVHGAKNPLARY